MKKKILIFLLITTIFIYVLSPSAYAINIEYVSANNKITDTLNEQLKISSSNNIQVAITLEDIETQTAVACLATQFPNYIERIKYLSTKTDWTVAENEEFEKYKIARRNAIKKYYTSYTNQFVTNCLQQEDVLYCSTYYPIIVANLTSDKIVALTYQDLVISIDYYDESIFETTTNIQTNQTTSVLGSPGFYSVSDNINHIKANNIYYIAMGTYVNVGILDVGIPNYNHPFFDDCNVTVHYANARKDVHATRVLEILTGVAPDANFYCTSYIDGEIEATLYSEMDWFLDNSIDIINISMELRSSTYGTVDASSTYGLIAQYLDDIIRQYDISIVMAAGNEGSAGITSGAMSYNVITVGNYCYALDQMADNSSYYTGNTYAFKPDISAPGYFEFSFIDDGYDYHYGTSYAAPLVTGVSACLMSCRGTFRVNPARVKATLAAAVSLDTNHHYTPEEVAYRRYGAGIIDAQRALDIVLSMTYIDGTMSSTQYDYTTQTLNLTTGSPVRIALAFEKRVDSTNVYTLADLDLSIYTPNGALMSYSSQTTNNNLEIIEFTPTIAGTYTVRITNFESATMGLITSDTIYSMAWIQ